METYYSNDRSTKAVIEGYAGNGKTLFSVYYRYGNGWSFEHYESHEIKLYEWAKHLHGNAPSGTPYGYFRASRNGKRVILA